jgi:hypothetical protein
MKEVYILVDGAGWLGTPTRLWRVEPRDGQIEGLDYLFDTDSWETDYGGYYASTAPSPSRSSVSGALHGATRRSSS